MVIPMVGAEAISPEQTKTEQANRDDPYLIFILLLSILALTALAIETLFPLDEGTRAIFHIADTLVCVFFFVDFLISLKNARNKLRYLLTWGWLDLISSIPAIEIFRVGRAARILRIIRVLRGIRAARVLGVHILERRGESTLLAGTFLSMVMVAVSAIGVLHFEVPHNGNIKTAEDAIWWAMSTITTVGYGDLYPVSAEGRILAIALMVMGVGIFATLSAVLAFWFLAPVQETREDELALVRKELAEVKQMIAALHQQNKAQ